LSELLRVNDKFRGKSEENNNKKESLLHSCILSFPARWISFFISPHYSSHYPDFPSRPLILPSQ
jgi:hypothetical protein